MAERVRTHEHTKQRTEEKGKTKKFPEKSIFAQQITKEKENDTFFSRL